MRFGEIIKKSWTITWRYRALWVLGLFAGVTGGSASGGSSGRSSYSPSSSGSRSNPFSGLHTQDWLPALERMLPLLVVTAIGLFVISFVWWILSVAARGGLIHAVNEIESGRTFSLGAAWSAGFSRFWSLLGVSLLLYFPLFVLVMLFLFAVIVPILLPLARGTEPGAAAIVPICGVLAIGFPVLLVGSIVLGIMHILSNRLIMLSGHGAIQAAGESWRAFRSRFKDVVVMYFVSIGLNIVAGLAIGIPMAIIILGVTIPAVIAGTGGHWGTVAAEAGVGVVIVVIISLIYTAIWGTFTSALWTVFYRRLTGMEVMEPVAAPPAPPAPPAPAEPAPALPEQPQPEPPSA